ncbi:hypothetical protein V8E54_001594 [Elaphomyces granulatus]
MAAEGHVQERRAKRAFCVYCQQHKEDWRPHKHKIQHGQVPARAFGMDITNTRVPNGINMDTRGYRIRGSKTIGYCGACNVALCQRGSCWNLWHQSIIT